MDKVLERLLELQSSSTDTTGCSYSNEDEEEHEQLILKLDAALKLQKSIMEWIEETKQPLPEGHIPIVSLNGVRFKLESLVKESKNGL